jgi:hypothetical protein
LNIKGYLLISCFIIGPGEKQPAHGRDENFNEDEEQMDDEKMKDFTDEQKKAFMEKKQGIFVLGDPSLLDKSMMMDISYFRLRALCKYIKS